MAGELGPPGIEGIAGEIWRTRGSPYRAGKFLGSPHRASEALQTVRNPRVSRGACSIARALRCAGEFFRRRIEAANGESVRREMGTTEQFSDSKKRLLEKFLRGEVARQNWEAPLEHRNASDPIPLAPSQYQVWLHSQMAPNSPLYNEPRSEEH